MPTDPEPTFSEALSDIAVPDFSGPRVAPLTWAEWRGDGGLKRLGLRLMGAATMVFLVWLLSCLVGVFQ